MRIVFVAACLAAASSALTTIEWGADESGALIKPDMFVALDAVAGRRMMRMGRRPPRAGRRAGPRGRGRGGRGGRGAKAKGPSFLTRAKNAAKAFGNKAVNATKKGIAKGQELYKKAQPTIQELGAIKKDLGINASSLGAAKKWGTDVLSLGTSLWNNPMDFGKWGQLGGKLFSGAKKVGGMIKAYKDGRKKRGKKGFWPWQKAQTGVYGAPAGGKIAPGEVSRKPRRPAPAPASAAPDAPKPRSPTVRPAPAAPAAPKPRSPKPPQDKAKSAVLTNGA